MTSVKVAEAIDYACKALRNLKNESTNSSRCEAVFWEVEWATDEIIGVPVIDGPEIRYRRKEARNWDPYKFYNEQRVDALIRRARSGDFVAADAACEIATQFIEDGLVLPDGLREYIIDVLLKQLPMPKKKPGRTPYANYARDFRIACTIRHVMDLGFRPTKNRATKTESACSIVKGALERLGIYLSEPGIEKIWERFAPDLIRKLS
jgi:hypothetical protein